MLGSSHWGRLRRRALVALEVAAAIATIAVVGIGLIDRLTPSASAPALPEGRQIVAFRQLASQICRESARRVRDSFSAARSPSEALGSLSRATLRGVNELSGVTPPASPATTFAAYVLTRRHVAGRLLDLQRAIEIGDTARQIEVEAELVDAETRSRKLSRALRLRGCTTVLPVDVHDLTS